MISRLRSFRWKILLTTAITFFVVYGLKSLDWFQGFNEHLNEAYQTVGMEEHELDTTLVIFRVTDDIAAPGDSIGKWVSYIASHQPKVVAVDFEFHDSTLFEKFNIDPAVKIIQALGFDHEDTVHSEKIFKGDVEFGNVFSLNDKIYLNDELVSTLPWLVASTYDLTKAQYFKSGSVDFRYIRYRQGYSPYYNVPLESARNIMPGFLKGKMVLVGYFGRSENRFSLDHRPDKFDNVDVQETPASYQFGAFVLASTISTILNGSFLFSSIACDVSIILVIIAMSCVVIFSGAGMNKKVLYLVSKAYIIFIVLVLTFGCIYCLHYLNIFPDLQAYCTALIISSELSFWFTLK